MKKIILILMIAFLSGSLIAQNYSSMTRDQLNSSLIKAKDKIRVGAVMTGFGAAAGLVGAILFYSNNDNKDLVYKNNQAGNMLTGQLLAFGGITIGSVGLAKLIKGSSRKKKIEIQLVRINGTACKYGAGLKMYF